MKTCTLLPVAMIFVTGAAAMAFAAGGGHGDREADREAHTDRLFKDHDQHADGVIDKSEIEAARVGRFTDSDANNGGALTESEVIAAVRARAEDRAEKMAKRMMRWLDSNDDGAVSMAEYEAMTNKRMVKMMDRLDADKDGVITKAEAQNAQGWGRHKRHGASE